MIRTTCIFNVILFTCFFILLSCKPDKIDRKALVNRHKVQVNKLDTLASLTVGNGKFAYTTDFTGLQSFFSHYKNGIPLGTQSEWGWHDFPDTAAFRYEETLKMFSVNGREVPYAVQGHENERSSNAASYFRQNPHRLHLGVVGMDFLHGDGTVVEPQEIQSISQELDVWTGEIFSKFSIGGVPVAVTTYAHQQLDQISAEVVSPLIADGSLKVKIHFPYPSGQHADAGADWNHPEKHQSTMDIAGNAATIFRKLDSTNYFVKVSWEQPASIFQEDAHFFYLIPEKDQNMFSFSVNFSEKNNEESLPGFKETSESSKLGWENFWMSGGAVDFSSSTDPRASELERRVVLSQYLTKAQCAGNFPPQETGLTYNSWFGKFHLEMHWWHGVHYALWGRAGILEKSLDYYRQILPKARERAERQGFDGVRWPKMTSNSGRDSPSDVGSFLIWQQPHSIYLAELCYQADPRDAFWRIIRAWYLPQPILWRLTPIMIQLRENMYLAPG